jgi:hypothetical protein
MPFVVTATLGAAAACGGTVRGSGSERNGTGGSVTVGRGNGGADVQFDLGTGGGTVISNPPQFPSTVCPAVLPVANTYCYYVGPACAYGDCYGYPVNMAQCQGQVWELSISSCNPPQPPPERTCPASAPIQGSYCNYQGPECEYTYGGCPYPDTRAVCNAYQWSVILAPPCNPPAPLPPDAGPPVDAGSPIRD